MVIMVCIELRRLAERGGDAKAYWQGGQKNDVDD